MADDIITQPSTSPQSAPGQTEARVVNGLTVLVGLLVLAIGAGAFVLSYDALHAVAIEAGKPAGKAWIFPLLVDGALIVFTLTLLVFQLLRASVRAWVGLVVLFTVATIGFNLAHAPGSVLGWSAAIVAPLSLFLATEALRHIAKTFIERAAHVASIADLLAQQAAARAEFERLIEQDKQNRAERLAELERLASQIERDRAKMAELQTELKTLRADKRQSSYTGISDETRQQAAVILAERSDISGAELGRLIGKSDTTGRRLKAELLPVVAGGQNHNGHNGNGVPE